MNNGFPKRRPISDFSVDETGNLQKNAYVAGHSWISAKDLYTGEYHTYGRWKTGYGIPPNNKHSGVRIDGEILRDHDGNIVGGWDKDSTASVRCKAVCDFSPTINEGYKARRNNCSSYARTEWERISGERLNADMCWLWDDPEKLKNSIIEINSPPSKIYIPILFPITYPIIIPTGFFL